MPSGSGLLTRQAALNPHLTTGHGISAEVGDLRKDLVAELSTMAAISVQEWVDPVAPAPAGLLAATASTVAVQTKLAAALLAPGLAALLAYPRNVTFTTAGSTPADVPASATIVGTDINGTALTETVNLAQTATIAEGVKAFRTITSITYAAGDGAAGTVAIGYGKKFGFARKIKSRAGLAGAWREIAAGAVVTSGTIVDATTSAPNGTYSPSADPDASKDYAVYYEYDATAV